MAEAVDWLELAQTLTKAYQECHEYVIDFVDRVGPPDHLPSLDKVLQAHCDTHALWVESMRLGSQGSDTAKTNEMKISALWLSALDLKVSSGPAPRTKRRADKSPRHPRSPKGPRNRAKRSRSPADGPRRSDGKSKGAKHDDKNSKRLLHPIVDKLPSGKIICSSYNAGNCSSESCPMVHLCNWRTKDNVACGKKHRRCDAH
jgi:hypothetical protein